MGWTWIFHTSEPSRFFDKAATRMTGEVQKHWRLCNVMQVEDLKCLCRMLPIWLCAIPFAAVFLQINTLFVEQATKMDRSLGSMIIPPASMSVLNVASIFLFTLIYPSMVVPVARMISALWINQLLRNCHITRLGHSFCNNLSLSVTLAFATTFLLVSLYWMSISFGPLMPVICSLGAYQLSDSEDIEKYFRVLAMIVSIGQLLAVTVVTYVDDGGLCVWGFGLCTATFIASTTLIAGRACWFCQHRASGNSFLRNMQVLVVAWRKRSLPLPTDSSLLHECQGDLLASPGQRKLQHTSTLGYNICSSRCSSC